MSDVISLWGSDNKMSEMYTYGCSGACCLRRWKKYSTASRSCSNRV